MNTQTWKTRAWTRVAVFTLVAPAVGGFFQAIPDAYFNTPPALHDSYFWLSVRFGIILAYVLALPLSLFIGGIIERLRSPWLIKSAIIGFCGGVIYTCVLRAPWLLEDGLLDTLKLGGVVGFGAMMAAVVCGGIVRK